MVLRAPLSCLPAPLLRVRWPPPALKSVVDLMALVKSEGLRESAHAQVATRAQRAQLRLDLAMELLALVMGCVRL